MTDYTEKFLEKLKSLPTMMEKAMYCVYECNKRWLGDRGQYSKIFHDIMQSDDEKLFQKVLDYSLTPEAEFRKCYPVARRLRDNPNDLFPTFEDFLREVEASEVE